MTAIAMLGLTLVPGLKKVHLVWTNQLLMEKDKSDFADVWELMQKKS